MMEPLPQLNYLLIYRLIALARPHLNKHQRKRLDYVVDGRHSYYESHAKQQVAYRELSDANACAVILDMEIKNLKLKLEDALSAVEGEGNNDSNSKVAALRTRLDDLETQRVRNNEDVRVGTKLLELRTKMRQHVSAWFSDLKVIFLRDEVPWLVALGKKCYQHAMEQEGMLDSSPPVIVIVIVIAPPPELPTYKHKLTPSLPLPSFVFQQHASHPPLRCRLRACVCAS